MPRGCSTSRWAALAVTLVTSELLAQSSPPSTEKIRPQPTDSGQGSVSETLAPPAGGAVPTSQPASRPSVNSYHQEAPQGISAQRIVNLERRLRELEAQRDIARLRAAVKPPPVVAGFSGGNFFIRSRDGAFRLSPSLRLQVDAYAFAPDFEAPGQPGHTLFVRRARPELFGGLFHERVQFMVAGDFADMPNGLASTDNFLIFNFCSWLRVQVGQFDLPFTQENRTSDRYIEFLERSFVVRNLGTANKEPGIMVFGGPESHWLYYSVGLFNGDGMNLRNLDDSFDLVGRFFLRPLAHVDALLDRVQIGGSFAWGERSLTNSPYLGGATPRGGGWLTTSSNYPLFFTEYSGADGKGTRLGLVPEGSVSRAAAEISLPIGPFALRSEYIYLNSDVDENILDIGAPLRIGGKLNAHGVYALLSFWPLGDSRILPDAGVQGAPLFDATGRAPRRALNLQLSVRFDYVWARYRAGEDAGTHSLGASQIMDTYEFWDLAFGVNIWWTRHVRLSLNYILNHIESDRANLPSPDQNVLHELAFRAAVAL